MNTNSPADIERDAERVRAEIANTAEHLKAKVSPGQLMDEVVDYFKAGDANVFVGNLKRQVRDNPLALGLIGGGLAWLMMGSGTPSLSRSSHTGYRGTGRPTSTDFSSTDYDTSSASSLSGSTTGGSTVGRTGTHSSASSHSSSGVLDKTSGALGASADAARRTAHDAADSASAAWGSVRDTASHGLSDAGESLSHAADRVGEAGMRMRRNVVDVLDREPLVLGAIGLAVGAAIAAMLPTTRTEEQYLGDASRKAQDRAKDLVSEGYEKAKHVADDAYSAAKEEVKSQVDTKADDKPATSSTTAPQASNETSGPKVTSTTSSTPSPSPTPRTLSGN